MLNFYCLMGEIATLDKMKFRRESTANFCAFARKTIIHQGAPLHPNQTKHNRTKQGLFRLSLLIVR